ncbi:Txe/YoeB family addiction module toxin [Mangrovibacterium marinum]|uniref:Putative mRNA interferase YoeB n=1 Tax=Mangrovibacterium marinum TaxID=1639118 RepID=A0A2T5BZR8_9BACT|nr:Txe/YoeB family addiction module toxin [Mangrovibacterium marinum]PTN07796.1 toxin YoeB [Mangrovibacterium marinum]
MEVIFKIEALTDLKCWKQSGNKAAQRKIQTLLKEISRTPYVGGGQPEPLKYELTGYWSRRINKEHRIVYRVNEANDTVEIHSLRGYYLDK